MHKHKGVNMSILDGILRLFGAIIIGAVAGAFGSWVGLLAIPLVVTGLAGYCPLYSVFGISTCKAEIPEGEENTEEPKEQFKKAA